MKKTKLQLLSFVSICVLSSGGVAFAANNTDFVQQINPGTLATNILDQNGGNVVNPSVNMSPAQVSAGCAIEGSTGTLGSNTQRLYVDNPEAANNGWTLSIAATDGPTALWTTSGSETLDYNDPTDSGCTDGGDSDSAAGQLSLDPSVGTITADCVSCDNTSITRGSASSFAEGSVDSITLINAGLNSDDIWRGYLTGVEVTQSIPAATPSAEYRINLTLTATAQ